MLLIDIGPLARAHLARALDSHRRWCRTNRVPFPDGLLALERHLTAEVGQHGPNVVSVPIWPDPAPVLMGYEAAARVLGVSVRTLRRLVAEGQIAPVRIGRSVRFTPAALARFAERREPA